MLDIGDIKQYKYTKIDKKIDIETSILNIHPFSIISS